MTNNNLKTEKMTFWSKFKEDKLAVIALITIILLLFMAIYAPILANGRPFFMLDRVTGEYTFPFLRYIFAPDSTEKTIEIICNYLLIFLSNDQ